MLCNSYVPTPTRIQTFFFSYAILLTFRSKFFGSFITIMYVEKFEFQLKGRGKNYWKKIISHDLQCNMILFISLCVFYPLAKTLGLKTYNSLDKNHILYIYRDKQAWRKTASVQKASTSKERRLYKTQTSLRFCRDYACCVFDKCKERNY